MALRLGRMTYVYNPSGFSPHGWVGIFYDTVALAWVQRAISQGALTSTDDLEADFEADFPGDTFDWSTPGPTTP